MINWREHTDNPVDKKVRDNLLKYLLSIRNPLTDNYYKYISTEANEKSVLDIGICEHTIERMDSPSWKHNLIVDNAKYSLGIDIDLKLINKLKEKGYNVIHCDATSDVYLEEKFDLIHIGDVIEHVNNPIALLSFAKRHLKDGGKIIVRTPNPYNFNYVHIQRKIGTASENMEHVSYICPMQAHEIALRSGLSLNKYLVLYPKGFSIKGFLHAGYYVFKKFLFRHAFAEIFAKPETYSTIYVYEFAL